MDLAVYKDLMGVLQESLDAVDAPSSFYGPLNVLPRLMSGKWKLAEIAGFRAFVSDKDARLIPPLSQAEYYRAIVEWAQGYRVLFVPEYMVEPLRARRFKVTKIQTEYLMDPARLAALPGGRLRNRRYEVSRARTAAEALVISPKDFEPALKDVTRRWYAEAKDRLWRPSEKTLIDWLIDNWTLVKEIEATAACAAVFDRETGEMIAYEMGSRLSGRFAVSFTQRSDREKTHGLFAGSNLLCSITLAEHLGLTVNDGPADHKELAARKQLLCSGTIDFYAVERR